MAHVHEWVEVEKRIDTVSRYFETEIINVSHTEYSCECGATKLSFKKTTILDKCYYKEE